MLIAMAGLPAAGKSSVAQELGRALPAAVVSVDPIEAAMWRAGVERTQPTGLAAYLVAEAVADTALGLGQSVIIDAVNAVQGHASSGEGWPTDTRRPSRSSKWCAPTRGCTASGWSAAPGASKASRSRPGKQSGSGRPSTSPGQTIGWCSIRPPTWPRTWPRHTTT
ncbi:AAA family ATPase [Streptomyces sp. NPDC059389]|uniref:AAA family ATPase n=1 Tax=Streptomyces sp. NPDC059389 TaxID=3346818 RepID=UPI0036C22ECE